MALKNKAEISGFGNQRYVKIATASNVLLNLQNSGWRMIAGANGMRFILQEVFAADVEWPSTAAYDTLYDL